MRLLPIFLAAGLASLSATFAQTTSGTATTDPVGYVTLTIPAGSTVPSQTAICLPLHSLATVGGQVTGTISSVTSGTISNSNAGWTAGSLSNAASPYFVRIKSGAAMGRTLQILSSPSNTTTDLAVNNQGTDLTTLGIAVGDSYEIIEGDTLKLLFGDPTTSGIQGGANAASADNVQYWNGGVWQTFYFNTTNNRWQQSGINSVSADNFVIRPDAGLIYVRRATTGLTMTFTGSVPTTDLRYVIKSAGSTFVANGFPVDTTLAALGYNNPGWVSKPSTDAASADQVLYWNGGVWQHFYFNSTNNRWQQVGINSVSANGFSIKAGQPVMIQKAGSTSGVATTVQSLPYSLN